MQAFNREISDKYGLEIKSVAPFRDYYIINTSRGRKILKKLELPPEHIMFIHFVKEHLYRKGFKNLDRYLCTQEDEPFIVHDGECYVFSDALEGRECNFNNREDIAGASRLLGELHRASKGFEPPGGCRVRDELGKLPMYFSKRLDEIKKLKKVAKKGKSAFDYLYLDRVDYFYNLGMETLQEIQGPRYTRLVERAREEGAICHHDYTHHNIVVNEGRMTLLNFNYCCFELKTYDLANLIRRKMRRCGWAIGEARHIVEQYRTAEELSNDEFYVLKLMLKFPQKFWRVANRFYNSRRSWSEKSYLMKLKEVIDEVNYHKRFIDRFDELF